MPGTRMTKAMHVGARLAPGVAWILSGCLLIACVSQATAGKIMTGTGGVLLFVGALDLAGAFGGDCRDNGDQAVTSCRASGDRDRSEAVISLVTGSALVTAGVLLWTLTSETSAPAPQPTAAHAEAPRPPPPAQGPVDEAALRFARDRQRPRESPPDQDAGS